jgi:hypothetical protein
MSSESADTAPKPPKAPEEKTEALTKENAKEFIAKSMEGIEENPRTAAMNIATGVNVFLDDDKKIGIESLHNFLTDKDNEDLIRELGITEEAIKELKKFYEGIKSDPEKMEALKKDFESAVRSEARLTEYLEDVKEAKDKGADPSSVVEKPSNPMAKMATNFVMGIKNPMVRSLALAILGWLNLLDQGVVDSHSKKEPAKKPKTGTPDKKPATEETPAEGAEEAPTTENLLDAKKREVSIEGTKYAISIPNPDKIILGDTPLHLPKLTITKAELSGEKLTLSLSLDGTEYNDVVLEGEGTKKLLDSLSLAASALAMSMTSVEDIMDGLKEHLEGK